MSLNSGYQPPLSPDLCWEGEQAAWGAGILGLKNKLMQREVQEAPYGGWAPENADEGAWTSDGPLFRHS